MSTIHVLDFVCEGWVGNFELELFSFVFGLTDYEHERRNFADRLTEDERAHFEEFYEDFFEGWHGDYGWTFVEVSNAKLAENANAINSVRVRVSDERWKAVVTLELIEEWKARTVAFFLAYGKSDGSFLGLVHSTVTTTTTPGELL